MSSEVKVKYDLAQRLQAFIRSDLFAVNSSIAKSEYWKYHSKQLHTNVGKKYISIEGESGFYVPQQVSLFHRTTRKVEQALLHPSKAFDWVVGRFMSLVSVPRLMSYEKAFDAVMSCADVADPHLSSFRINHARLGQHKNVFTNVASVKKHYQKWSGYKVSEHIINSYYYQNILRNYIGEEKIGTVLEIGAGNGNLMSIMYHDWAPIKCIILDLPETLAVSIPFLGSLFPTAKFVMPNEVQTIGLYKDYDFAFLTVDQISIIDNNSCDLAINNHSFQEMTQEQIYVYFELIQRVCRDGGFFFTANRVEKIPCGPDSFMIEQMNPPNRFAEYPWNLQNEKLVYEISRLHRLVQLDDVSIRLERIHK
jgi:putative sugar O-methyltransferase